MNPTAIILVACMAVLATPSLPGRDPVAALVDKALERDQELRQRRLAYEFELTARTEKMDRTGRILKDETVTAVVRPQADIRYEVELKPGEMTQDGATSEKNRKQLRDSEKVMAVMDLKKLAPRFILKREKDETVRGIRCQVVSFKPRPGQPYDSREEKIINALEGRFWLHPDDASIVQSEARLPAPVSVAWIFASMRELSFRYESMELPNGDTGPARFTLLFDLQTGPVYKRFRQTSVMKDYRLASVKP
jgi:hypothetical protein